MKPGDLYLIPTVLSEGQFDTLSQRVLDTVSGLDYFLVENIRTARRFISGLKLGKTIGDLEFRKLDKNTVYNEVLEMLKPVLEGRDAGVMSEAGCPGIADPGSRVVGLAHEKGIRVIPLAGPSSIFLALMGSGFNGQNFTFHGYLPIDRPARDKAIRKIEQQAVRDDSTQIFIETPYRNEQLLKAILDVCNESTHLCIARDLNGSSEWVYSAPVSKWRKIRPELHKIPAVFLISRS